MINKRDFAAMEAEIKASGNSEEVIQKYTGPATGLMYDSEDGFKVAAGWNFDAEGNVVRVR